jgi:hypothetical protein
MDQMFVTNHYRTLNPGDALRNKNRFSHETMLILSQKKLIPSDLSLDFLEIYDPFLKRRVS